MTPCYTTLHYTSLLHFCITTLLHCPTLWYTIHHCTLYPLYYRTLHNTALHYSSLCSTALISSTTTVELQNLPVQYTGSPRPGIPGNGSAHTATLPHHCHTITLSKSYPNPIQILSNFFPFVPLSIMVFVVFVYVPASYFQVLLYASRLSKHNLSPQVFSSNCEPR